MMPVTSPREPRMGAVLTLRSMGVPSLRMRVMWRPVNPWPSRSRLRISRCSAMRSAGMKGKGWPITSLSDQPKVRSAA